MTYLYLAFAIVSEVVGTSALKASEEFTKLVPSIVVLIGYALAFYFMTLTLRTLSIGITYAIWSGAGIVLVALVGLVFYKEVPDTAAIVGMVFIIIGIMIMHFFSKTLGH